MVKREIDVEEYIASRVEKRQRKMEQEQLNGSRAEEENEQEKKRPRQKHCKVCKATDHQAGLMTGGYMDCPNKPCYLCKRPGHTTEQCPHKSATEHGVVAAPLRRSLGPLDLVHARQLRSNVPMVRMPLVIPNKVDRAISHRLRVTDMEFHPTNDSILISGDEEGNLCIWDYGKVDKETVHEDVHNDSVNSIKFHPRQEGMMYTASDDGRVCFSDLERGSFSDVLDLNPGGFTCLSSWRSIHGMDLNNRREVALAADNLGFLYQLDIRANKRVEKPMLIHQRGSKVVGVNCHPGDPDVFITCGNDRKTRLWDMRKLAPGSCLVELDHPRVVTSAYFSPITGNKIMTTCLDNRIRVWDNICADLSEPSREIVHSHSFNRYITPFRAEWDPKDRFESLVVIGRYTTMGSHPLHLHPIDFLDVNNGRLLEEVHNDRVVTVCPLNKLHPRLHCMATGTTWSLFIWRPKDAPEFDGRVKEVDEAGNESGDEESIDSDDDD